MLYSSLALPLTLWLPYYRYVHDTWELWHLYVNDSYFNSCSSFVTWLKRAVRFLIVSRCHGFQEIAGEISVEVLNEFVANSAIATFSIWYACGISCGIKRTLCEYKCLLSTFWKYIQNKKFLKVAVNKFE